MELNSDKEYYQKYIQYKHQYIMLKQLKNKNNNYNYNYNELEGGGILESLFGKSKATKAKEKAEKEAKAASLAAQREAREADEIELQRQDAEAAYLANFSGDGTYLVFSVTNFNDSDYPNLKRLNYDNEKRKSENSKDGTDIPIMEKVEFTTHFKHAYIVEKIRDVYTYKYIINDDEFDSIYTTILNEVDNIKKYNCNCNIVPVNNNNNNNVSTLTANINDSITVYNNNYANHQKFLYEDLVSKIDNQINNGDHQKFVTHTLSFAESKFDATNNDSFLMKMNTEAVSKTIKENVQLNMILKIKDTYKEDTNYIFDKIITKDDASYTTTYAKINKFIAEHDLNAKGGVTDQILNAQNQGQNQGQIAVAVPNTVQYVLPHSQFQAPVQAQTQYQTFTPTNVASHVPVSSRVLGHGPNSLGARMDPQSQNY